SNPELKMEGTQQAVRISQRSGVATALTNPSSLGGREKIGLYTTFLTDGTLFYYLTVVPENDAAAFQDAFRHIGEPIKLTEARWEKEEGRERLLRDPLDRAVGRGLRRHRRRRAIEVAPRERTVDAPRLEGDAPRRRIDRHDDEALEERRDVVVEHRRQPFG